jgi:hypothetical protein
MSGVVATIRLLGSGMWQGEVYRAAKSITSPDYFTPDEATAWIRGFLDARVGVYAYTFSGYV